MPLSMKFKQENRVRIVLHYVATICLAIGVSVGLAAQTAALGAEGAAKSAAMEASAMQPKVVGETANPVADPKAVVTQGNARFTLLTPELIRMEWAADGKFEDHASFVFLNRRLPTPKFEQQLERIDASQQLTIKTSALTLTYTSVSTPGADNRFSEKNLAIKLSVDGKDVVWHPGLADPENLQGTTRTLDGALGSKTREPIGEGLVSRSGWALVDDSTRPLFDSANFSFKEGEKSPWPWVIERPAGERQDLYFFGYGHDYRKALSDYICVAGRIPLPPRFAFGTWWSRYWIYREQDSEDIIHDFHENSTPLDVFVIDMGWHKSLEQLKAMGEGDKNNMDQSKHFLGWSGYTWNNVLFPYPEMFLDRLHASHLKTSLNLHPASGIQPWESSYPAMAKAMGIDPATKQYVPYDITSKKFAENYFNLVLHPLEKQGIDFWWLDWQQEQNTKMAGVTPTWWINYVHFTDQEREGKRPILFHRWGGLGNHRYQIGFSGDTISVWESLAFQPWFTATAANVGYAYWSHDIGGHMPGAVDPELYTRWIQFGIFSPILRTHTTKNPDSERRIWAYPEPYSDIMRDDFHLRYALIPYIYTEARRTYDTGVAFLRPLYYDWPEMEQAYAAKNEYLFGEQMIVAPVTAPADKESGFASESIWLPEGDWIEWDSGKRIAGPGSLTRNFSIQQIPVYVRAGAIVPMAPKMSYTSEKPVDPLIVNVFPLSAGQKSSYTLYEDSGESRQYQTGKAVWTAISASQTKDELTITISPARGSYPGMPAERAYQLRLPGDWPPASDTMGGNALKYNLVEGQAGWHYECDSLTTVVTLPRLLVTRPVIVHVRRSGDLMARR